MVVIGKYELGKILEILERHPSHHAEAYLFNTSLDRKEREKMLEEIQKYRRENPRPTPEGLYEYLHNQNLI